MHQIYLTSTSFILFLASILRKNQDFQKRVCFLNSGFSDFEGYKTDITFLFVYIMKLTFYKISIFMLFFILNKYLLIITVMRIPHFMYGNPTTYYNLEKWKYL